MFVHALYHYTTSIVIDNSTLPLYGSGKTPTIIENAYAIPC
jgi:hypothetical protein